MNQFDLSFEKKNIIIKNAIKFCHDYVIFKYKQFVDKTTQTFKATHEQGVHFIYTVPFS